MNNINKLEILAPAGNYKSLEAAVYAGADSVYFGAKALNARRNASNFTDEEIKSAVNFCHLYNIKAYLTLNTLMFDSEIKEVTNQIMFACNVGFDAIIVQDLGVISLIKQICPDMPVHASTQMSVHNLADANELYARGIERVVLARELSKNEILNITQNSKIETEIFVHGALCYCISGQCYFSAFWGERSGNRGLCAQVCRLPFGVISNNRYNLSLKDLCLIDYVNELKLIGVSALKIEGRMKNADYVYTAVSQFKNSVCDKKYDKDILDKSFSRSGFTQGYYLSKIDADMFGIRSEQDKLKSKENKTLKITDIEQIKIQVDMKFNISKQKTELIISDNSGNMFISNGNKAEASVNKSLARYDVIKSLSKLNGTPFTLNDITGFLEDNIYLPVSALNELRRNAVDNLIQLRQIHKNYNVNLPKINLSHCQNKNTDEIKLTASFFNASQISERILKSVEYASLDLFKLDEVQKNILSKYSSKFIAEIPRVFFEDEKQIENELTKIKLLGINKAKCHSIGRMKLALNCGFDVVAGFGLNIANSISAQFLSDYSPLYITLSPELSVNQINNIKTYDKKAIVSYGYFPLMITRACPVKHEIGCDKCRKHNCAYITDRKDKKFAVLCNHNVSQILNSVPLYIADKMNDFKNISYCEMFFTTENENSCHEIISNYLQKKSANTDFTRGIYFRKLK